MFLDAGSQQVISLSGAVKVAGASTGKLAYDFSNLALCSVNGIGLPDVKQLTHNIVIVSTARLARHRCRGVQDEVATEVFFPSWVFARLSRDSWEARLVRALAIRQVGLLASAVAPCPRSWLPQIQSAGSSCISWRGSLRGVLVGVHSCPARGREVGHMQLDRTMVSPDVATTAKSCFADREHQCVEHQSIETEWRKGTARAGWDGLTSTRHTFTGEEFVVGGYRASGWEGAAPSFHPPFHMPAALAFILEDVFQLYREVTSSVTYGLTSHHGRPAKEPGRILYHAASWERAQVFHALIKAEGQDVAPLALILQSRVRPLQFFDREILAVDRVPADWHMAILSEVAS